MISNLFVRTSTVSLSISLGLLTNSASGLDDDCPSTVDECMTVTGNRDRWNVQSMPGHYYMNEVSRTLAEMESFQNERDGGGGAGSAPNPKDKDGDGQIDCWKDITADPDAPISPFNDPREKGPHRGLDIKVQKNTEVYSPGDGVVARIHYTAANGYYVRLNLDNGNQITFLHFSGSSDDTVGLSEGDRVSAGQLVGLSGNTGDVDGPNGGYHVHVEVVEGYHGDNKAPDSYTRIDPVEEYGGSNCQAAE